MALDEEIRLPRGWRALAPDDDAWRCGEDDGPARSDLRAAADGGRFRLTGSVRYTDRLVPADDWPALRDAARAFDAAATTRLLARKGD